MAITMPPPKVCRRIRRLRGKLGSDNAQEVDTARKMLEALLAKHGLKWDDLDAVCADDASPLDGYNVLNLVDGLIAKYVWLAPEQRLFVALWVLHTYVFDRYNLTPRLALLSPVFGCGKTTLLTLIEQLVPNPSRYINVTAALVYRLISAPTPRTLLLDEGNNLGLLQDRVMRAVLNANRRGEKLGRAAGKTSSGIRDYYTYTPIGIAAKGYALPNDLIQRSVVVHMQKPPPGADLQRLNEFDLDFLKAMGALREEIRTWADGCKLNPDPELPLHWRAADNWRVLLAIADNFGRGEEARKAALTLSGGLPDEDPALLLLMDIRTVFDTLGVDRIGSKVLLEKLHALESGMWLTWRGPNDDQQPHKLTENELARLLGGTRLGGGFGIHPRTVWPRGSRKKRGASSKGYYRRDFEAAWAAYCTPAGTPAHRHTPPAALPRPARQAAKPKAAKPKAAKPKAAKPKAAKPQPPAPGAGQGRQQTPRLMGTGHAF